MRGMDELVEIAHRPQAREVNMLAGWRQWADAGEVSSALPRYLIEQMGARRIGQIRARQFYLFQVPGMHHLLRPRIKLQDGYRRWLRPRRNELYYAGDEERGLVIFRGVEPNMGVERYAEALLNAATELGVKRIAIVAGVYGAVPYDKDRQISCVYSLPELREGLSRYAVQFSGYRGGSSVGTWLAHLAEKRGIELVALYALVPYYDLSGLSRELAAIKIDRDFKAWYDLLLRLDHMFGLQLDLTQLHLQTRALARWVRAQIEEYENAAPGLGVRAYIEALGSGFEEMTFVPLSDLWERELRDLFDE